jgi:organic radical activating enzyme
VSSTADRTLEVIEIFESIQGEGPSIGQPALFLRLAGCNLGCQWCDTAYAWDWKRFGRKAVTRIAVSEFVEQIRALPGRRLVITGGEPLIQQVSLSALLAEMEPERPVEVETNGTIVPQEELLSRIDQWNVSAKLSHNGQPREKRIQVGALRALRDTGRAWLKLVVRSEADLEEAEVLVAELAWPKPRVLFMPLARNRDEHRQRAPSIAEASLRRGYGFSPRIHLDLWDGRRGK